MDKAILNGSVVRKSFDKRKYHMSGHDLVVCIWSINTQYVQSMTLLARQIALRDAVIAAYNVVKAIGGISPKPWGVFIAPEYLFAHPSVNGSHVYGEQRHLEQGDKERLLEWLKLVSAACEGMIIVPGTVAWQKPAERPVVNPPAPPGTKPFSRTEKAFGALLQHANRFFAGDLDAQLSSASGNQNALTTGAKMVSLLLAPANTLKFARNTAYVLYDGRLLLKYNKGSDFHEVLTGLTVIHIPGCKPGVFSVRPEGGGRDIKFGVEICLDHMFHTLGHSIPPDDSVDVHLLVSAYVAPWLTVSGVSMSGYVIHASSNASYSGVYRNGHSFFGAACGQQLAIPGYGDYQLNYYGIHVALDPAISAVPPLSASVGQP
ncbi:hypothetical protein NPS46_06465 [Pseudomonas putida]|uniref:hypothetical protein n=1 Tax=Pseudomonas putida TaxID=303 RepID=UPI002363F1DF|nr:hypothetical protein [Pseudomonas putida]MDD2052188.1 hypothetical protein [Pseudomonas putida]